MSLVPFRRPDELASPTVATRVSPAEVEMLCALLMLQPGLLLSAKAELPPDLFHAANESGPWLFLTALYRYYDRYGAVPPPPVFDLECRRVCDERAAVHRPVSQPDWPATVAAMAQTEPLQAIGRTQAAYGSDLLARLLNERLVSQALSKVVLETPGHLTLANVPGLLDQLGGLSTRAESVRGGGTHPLFPTVDELVALETPTLIPTGIEFIDNRVLAGGCESGKVYGLLGPWGSFKTGLGVQLLTAAAEMQAVSDDPGLCVYFVYEGGKHEIRIRGIAQAAEMPKNTAKAYLEGRGDRSMLSTSAALKTYEVERYDAERTDPAERLGEVERMAIAEQQMRYVEIADMSGPKENPAAGSGYVNEIVGHLDRLTRTTGRPIRLVVVDYVKELCVRSLTARGWPRDRLRELMSPVPSAIRREVAERFGCAVWLLQQLNAEANKKAAGAAQHHADAAEARDFGENLWYCLTLSVPDRQNDNTLHLAVTKARDSAAPPTGIVVRIDPHQFKLVLTRDHMIDAGGKIVRSNFHQQLHGVDGAAPPPAGQNVPDTAGGDR